MFNLYDDSYMNSNIKKTPSLKTKYGVSFYNIKWSNMVVKFKNQKLDTINNLCYTISYGKTLHMLLKTNNNTWIKNINFFCWLNNKIYKKFKLKMVALSCLLTLLITNNTVRFKKFVFFWVQWSPINKHKGIIIRFIRLIKDMIFFLQKKKLKININITTKGKLGIRGDNKKKTNKYLMFTKIKNNNIKKTFYIDGIGSSSNHGHTFFKVKYYTFLK